MKIKRSIIYVILLTLATLTGAVVSADSEPRPMVQGGVARRGGCPIWEGRRLRSTNSRALTVQFTLGLGRIWDNGESDHISLYEAIITANSYTPDALGFPVSTKGNKIEFVRDPSRPQRVIADPGEKGGYTSQPIKQIRVPETFVDIVVVSEWEYEIRFYNPDQVRPKRNGFYRVAGEPTSVTVIRNPNPPKTDSLEITTVKNGAADKTEWKYDVTTDTWTYFRNDVETSRKLSQLNPIDPCERTETRFDLEDGSWTKTIKIFKAFPWGQEIVKKTEDPDGKALTTTYKYFDDPKGPHYTFLKTTIHPDGTVEKHNRHPDPLRNP